MPTLSDDDLDIRDLSEEELALAWDLWFDLAQATNDEDPPYTHGVFQGVTGAASALPSFDVAPFDSARGGGPPRS
jgi:hypothetical protein